METTRSHSQLLIVEIYPVSLKKQKEILFFHASFLGFSFMVYREQIFLKTSKNEIPVIHFLFIIHAPRAMAKTHIAAKER